MKKLLLIPTAIFPYLFCSFWVYVYSSQFDENALSQILSALCLIAPVLAVVLDIIYIVKQKNESPEKLLASAFVIKLIHIPTYIALFVIGTLLGLMFFMTFPLVLLIIITNLVTLLLSGIVAVHALIKGLSLNRKLGALAIACQFFFCIDVIALFIAWRKTKKQLKKEGVE